MKLHNSLRRRTPPTVLLFSIALIFSLCMIVFTSQVLQNPTSNNGRQPHAALFQYSSAIATNQSETSINFSQPRGKISTVPLIVTLDESLPRATVALDEDTPHQSSYTWPEATGSNCASYKAVLHIESGDQGAAAGTLFFQYMINQLIYADMHNLLPWIHLNNITQWVYDEDVHGKGSINFEMMEGWQVPWKNGPFNDSGGWPGRPFIKQENQVEGNEGNSGHTGGLKSHTWTFPGRGVWNDYFDPVSDFNPHDPTCRSLGLVHLEYAHLNPGIQFYAPFAVRSWEYFFLPQYLRSNYTDDGTLHNWFGSMRERAHKIVKKYFKFKQYLVDASFKVLQKNTQCLGLHVRHTDKAGLARRRIPVEDFLPYIEAYVKNGGSKVYLATDTGGAESQIREAWRDSREKLIVQHGIIRSNKFKPVFRLGKHNQTNTEVLIDIFSLSRCQFLLHGFSAVSESAIYLNLQLHNNSVDLEDPNHQSPEEFGKLVQRVLTRD